MAPERTPGESAAALDAAVDATLAVLARFDEPTSQAPLRPGGWCARETLGHLIDSACNNHRRFMVGQSRGVAKFDGYEQDEWVDRQHYRAEPWQALVSLWAAYNRHLAHVMRHTSIEAAAAAGLAPDGSTEVTVRFLMDDYVGHLQHHVRQMSAFLERQPRRPPS